MIIAAQMRAARAMLGIDQRQLAALAGVSLPTIQRMEASTGVVRAVVDSLEKVINALNEAGVELIAPGGRSEGSGRGVRLLFFRGRACDATSPRTWCMRTGGFRAGWSARGRPGWVGSRS